MKNIFIMRLHLKKLRWSLIEFHSFWYCNGFWLYLLKVRYESLDGQ